MMHRLGRMRRFLAMGMLTVVFLSGCGSTEGGPSTSSIQVGEEETEEETMAQELQKQIMAVLNVNRPTDDRMTSDASLEQAAEFFLTYFLQDPDSDPAGVENPTNLDGMLTDNRNDAFVYDGTLSAAQVGKKILDDLKELSNQATQKYKIPESIAIVYGKAEDKSAWLVLVHYPVEATGTGENENKGDDKDDADDSEKQEGTDSGSSQPTGSEGTEGSEGSEGSSDT